jgi:hypothetical protein
VKGNTDTTARSQTTQIARIAWFTTFVLPLILAALLLGVRSAQATPPVPDSTLLAVEEEFELEFEGEEEEGEFEAEACAVAEEESEEGELNEKAVEIACDELKGRDGKKAAGSASAAAPEECLLRSAHARVVASPQHHSLKLTVGYTTHEPTTATIDYGVKGGKGTMHLGTVKRHLGRSGVIRLTETGGSAMAKVEAAGRFTVRLHIARAPAKCRRFETEQLTDKHASERQIVWSQTN